MFTKVCHLRSRLHKWVKYLTEIHFITFTKCSWCWGHICPLHACLLYLFISRQMLFRMHICTVCIYAIVVTSVFLKKIIRIKSKPIFTICLVCECIQMSYFCPLNADYVYWTRVIIEPFYTFILLIKIKDTCINEFSFVVQFIDHHVFIWNKHQQQLKK